MVATRTHAQAAVGTTANSAAEWMSTVAARTDGTPGFSAAVAGVAVATVSTAVAARNGSSSSRAIALAVNVVVSGVLLAVTIRKRSSLKVAAGEADREAAPDENGALPTATPAAVGISHSRLQQITLWSDGWVQAGKLPGMLTMIARHGKVCYLHCSGYADCETKQLLSPRTIMRMYSMTKPVVSVVAMVLYERGLFQLDEPISKHLRCFAKMMVKNPDGTLEPAAREITFTDLLTHTAGLSYGDSDNYIDEEYEAAGCGWDAPFSLTLAEFVERLGKLPLAFHPGFSWRYSYATDLLGRLLEIISGLPLDELVQRELFGPLGMEDSGFFVPSDKLERFAQIYEVAVDDAPSTLEPESSTYQRFERYTSRDGTVAPPSPRSTATGAGALPPGFPLPNRTLDKAAAPGAAAEGQLDSKMRRSRSVPLLGDLAAGGGSRGYRRGYRAWRQGAAKGARGEQAEEAEIPLDRAALAAALTGASLLEVEEDPVPCSSLNQDEESARRLPTSETRSFSTMPETSAGNFTERPRFLSAGGGMVGTAHDFSRFCQMLLNSGELDGVRILSRKTIQFMTLNHLPLDAAGRRVDIDTIATDSGFSETTFDGIGFGLGWSVMTDPVKASIISSVGEFGWGGWASTFFLVDKEEDMFVLSLAQLAPSDRYPIRRQLRCLVYQSLDG